MDFQVCWDGPLPKPSVRDAKDLREVLADRSCTATGPVYYMYRDISRSDADRSWLSAQDLRYDITVIPPREICGEFIKTKGHYHPDNPSGIGYPEVYEVLAGMAHFLIQNHDFSDIVMIAASCRGDRGNPPGIRACDDQPLKKYLSCRWQISSLPALKAITGDMNRSMGQHILKWLKKDL